MLAAVKPLDILFVWDSSRLHRPDQIDAAMVRQHLFKSQVTVIEGGRIYDLSNPTDKMTTGIIDLFSRFQTELQQYKSKNGTAFRYESGYYRFGPVFGYDHDTKRKEVSINKDEGEIVKQIFQDHNTGVSLNKICSRLNLQHVRTKEGGKWTPTTVRRILLRPLYTGHYQPERAGKGKGVFTVARSFSRDKLIESHCYEPIIDIETYEQTLHHLLYQRTPQTYRLTRRQGKYLLTGFLVCGVCFDRLGKKDSDLSFRHSPVNHAGWSQSVDYYVLSATHKRHVALEAARTTIPASVAERLVVQSVLYLTGFSEYLAEYSRIMKDEAEGIIKDKLLSIKEIDFRLSEIDKQILVGVKNLLRLTGTPADLLQDELQKLDKEKNELLSNKSKLLSLIENEKESGEHQVVWVRENLTRILHGSSIEKRNVLKDILRRVKIYKTKIVVDFYCDIEIIFEIPGRISLKISEIKAWYRNAQLENAARPLPPAKLQHIDEPRNPKPTSVKSENTNETP